LDAGSTVLGASTRAIIAALALATVLVFTAVFLRGSLPARGAAPVALPDLVIMVPTDLVSIGTDPSNGHRQLRFTHITADVGAGPFEIDPHYDSNTQTSTFTQVIYNSPSPGVWNRDQSVSVAANGLWHPPSDYAFPLTSFTLNQVNADGSLGPVVATSPKTDYCITGDTMVSGVPNTPNQTFLPQSNCNDPTKPLGWSVGWADQYDQTDAGQPIDLAGVPDGTYILHATVDPLHVLTESDTNNDVTDTTLRISGTSVTVLSQTHPVTTPPTVGLTSPAPGAQVSGQVALSASASATAPATVASVQFLLDGQPLGSPVRTPPYTYTWTVGSTSPGDHRLSARAKDSDGNQATATPVPIVVVSGSSSVGGSGQTGARSGGAHGKSTLKVRVLRWRHGVLTLAVSNLPKRARLSVELKFADRPARFLNAPGGRLRLPTARPKVIVLRTFVGRRRSGGTVTLRLGKSPTVRIINPAASEMVSGTVPIVADVTDNVAISSVRFGVDGKPIGRPVTRGPYVIRWRTTGGMPGRHRISVVATDWAGDRASAATVITVQNPPPMTCFVLQAHLSADGHGVATSSPLHTAMPGETLLAFVSADGPAGPPRQTATVSGVGVRWQLVERANASSGDSEVWTATAHTILTTGQITATLSSPSFDESLTVIAIEGVKAVGTTTRASGSTGAPHLELTTSAATSLVFAVGNDSDRAVPRVLPSGWVPLDQWLDTRTGDTFWSQYTNQPTGRDGSVVAVRAAAATTDQWNLAAVELVNRAD
jgi:hypothetical protein